MPSREEWMEYVAVLRARQQVLHAEARPFEEKKIFIGPVPGLGWQGPDLTALHVEAIKGEVASIERTIQGVITREGLSADA